MPSDQDTAGLGRRAYIAATSAFADGSDSPRAFLERCIEVIEAQEERVGAFAATNFEGARAAADAAGERWKAGKTLSPIDGMPIGIKDIMETADMVTEQGSPLFAGWKVGRDCAAVAALREAGAVVVGIRVDDCRAAGGQVLVDVHAVARRQRHPLRSHQRSRDIDRARSSMTE